MLLHILICLFSIPFKHDAPLYAQVYVRVKILMATSVNKRHIFLIFRHVSPYQSAIAYVNLYIDERPL